MSDEQVRVVATVSGLVQGVYFRESTRKVAEAHAVTGTVANLPGGNVEAVFEGERSNVEKLIDYINRGPQGAHVDNVDIRWEKFSGEFTSFRVIRRA